MYFDPIRNAYIDSESGAIVYQENNGTSNKYNSNNVNDDSFILELAKIHEHSFSGPMHNNELLYSTPPSSFLTDDYQQLQQVQSQGERETDDWNFAVYLQYMDFEIPNDVYGEEFDENADFASKEIRASKSCRRQLLTLSTLICIAQVSFFYPSRFPMHLKSPL
jgi:hypothetical protein